MATRSDIQVRDALGEPITRRAFDVGGGVVADGPLIPELAEPSPSNPLFFSPANRASGVAPVTATLDAPGEASGWFPLVPGRTFYTWLTAGSWTGLLSLELSYDGGTTAVPITYGASQLMTFSRLGVTPFTVHEAGVTARLKAGADFSGTVTGRIAT